MSPGPRFLVDAGFEEVTVDGREASLLWEDVRHFRANPTRNWRIRRLASGEEAHFDGRIALEEVVPDPPHVLVIRPHQETFADKGEMAMSVKFLVSVGIYNDMADPWIRLGRGFSRASLLYRAFRETVRRNAGTQVPEMDGVLFEFDQITHQTSEFYRWARQDLLRVVRLSESLYGAVVQHHTFPPRWLTDRYREDHAIDTLDRVARDGFEVDQHRCAQCARARTSPRYVRQFSGTLSGLFAWWKWRSSGNLVLRPDPALLARLQWNPLPFDPELPLFLPRHGVLIDVRSLDTKIEMPRLVADDASVVDGHTTEPNRIVAVLASTCNHGAALQVSILAENGRLNSVFLYPRSEGSEEPVPLTWARAYESAHTTPRLGPLAGLAVNLLYAHAARQRERSVSEGVSTPVPTPAEVRARDPSRVREEHLDASLVENLRAPPVVRPVEHPRGPIDRERLQLAETVRSAYLTRVRYGPGRQLVRTHLVQAQTVRRWMSPEDAQRTREEKEPRPVHPNPVRPKNPLPEPRDTLPNPVPAVAESPKAPAAAPSADDILARIRNAMHSEEVAFAERAGRLQEALNRYIACARAEVLTRFARQNGVDVPPTGADEAAFALHELVEQLPELGGQAPAAPEPAPSAEALEDAEDLGEEIEQDLVGLEQAANTETPRWLETLRGMTATRPILLVGNKAQTQKLARLRKLGIGVEEAVISGRKNPARDAMLKAIRNRSYCAVFRTLFMDHNLGNGLTAACQASGTPMHHVQRGGLTTIYRALELLATR